MRRTLGLVVLMIPGLVTLAPAADVKVHVFMDAHQTSPFVYSAIVHGADGDRMVAPAIVDFKPYVVQARRMLANQLGYTQKTFGAQTDGLLPEGKVLEVRSTDLRTGKVLFSSQDPADVVQAVQRASARTTQTAAPASVPSAITAPPQTFAQPLEDHAIAAVDPRIPVDSGANSKVHFESETLVPVSQNSESNSGATPAPNGWHSHDDNSGASSSWGNSSNSGPNSGASSNWGTGSGSNTSGHPDHSDSESTNKPHEHHDGHDHPHHHKDDAGN